MGNNRIYNVDWNKLATWHVPVTVRGVKLLAFIKALVAPVNDLHSRFLNYRGYINYQLTINFQTCYIQMALNDKYDTDLRRIRIVDAEKKQPVVLWLKAENKPKVLYTKIEGNPLVLYSKGETAQFTVNVIIKVPADVVFDVAEMTAFINRYRLISKTFKIITF